METPQSRRPADPRTISCWKRTSCRAMNSREVGAPSVELELPRETPRRPDRPSCRRSGPRRRLPVPRAELEAEAPPPPAPRRRTPVTKPASLLRRLTATLFGTGLPAAAPSVEAPPAAREPGPARQVGSARAARGSAAAHGWPGASTTRQEPAGEGERESRGAAAVGAGRAESGSRKPRALQASRPFARKSRRGRRGGAGRRSGEGRAAGGVEEVAAVRHRRRTGARAGPRARGSGRSGPQLGSSAAWRWRANGPHGRVCSGGLREVIPRRIAARPLKRSLPASASRCVTGAVWTTGPLP